jgi:acyl dehydratase
VALAFSGELPKYFQRCAQRFKRKISNGFVTETRIAAALAETLGSDETLVVAIEKNTRFLKPVYMDDDIRRALAASHSGLLERCFVASFHR